MENAARMMLCLLIGLGLLFGGIYWLEHHDGRVRLEIRLDDPKVVAWPGNGTLSWADDPGWRLTDDGCIEGAVRNLSGRTLGIVIVEFTIHDPKTGDQIGSTNDMTSNLPNGFTWRFKIKLYGDQKNVAVRFVNLKGY